MNPDIIQALNASLAAHLTAIETYADLAACHDRAGLTKLASHWRDEATEEREHLDRILKRLEFFDAEEDFTHAAPGEADEDPAATLDMVLAMERSAAAIERAGILTAREAGDEGTADVFRENLKGSESAIYELMAWQRAIAIMGRENWLANQA